MSSCSREATESQHAPEYVTQLADDLSDGKITKMAIFGRGYLSTTTIPLRPETFDRIRPSDCAIIIDKPRLKEIAETINVSKYGTIDKDWDTYWHIIFYDESEKIVYNLYMGMKYNNYDFVYWKLDNTRLGDDGSLERWLYRNVRFQPCSRQSK